MADKTLSKGQGRLVARRFFRHKAALSGLIGLAALVIFVFSAGGIQLGTSEHPFVIPGWWHYTILDILEVTNDGQPTLDLLPSFIDGTGLAIGDHPFGQTTIGQDYFALVMRGTQQSLMVMIVVGLVATVLGTVLGGIAGYFRGFVDSFIMRFTDLIISIPAIIVGAVIGFQVGNLGVVFLALFLGLFTWTSLARLVRGEFLALRTREFIDAARIVGASSGRIIFRHMLPNTIGVIVVSSTLLMSSAILLETALSYLGFGVMPPDVSLGTLISQNQDAFSSRPQLFWYPGLFIISIALCVNFIGDGLRDAFDPKQVIAHKFGASKRGAKRTAKRTAKRNAKRTAKFN